MRPQYPEWFAFKVASVAMQAYGSLSHRPGLLLIVPNQGAQAVFKDDPDGPSTKHQLLII
jgi:hypothetical protein